MQTIQTTMNAIYYAYRYLVGWFCELAMVVGGGVVAMDEHSDDARLEFLVSIVGVRVLVWRGESFFDFVLGEFLVSFVFVSVCEGLLMVAGVLLWSKVCGIPASQLFSILLFGSCCCCCWVVQGEVWLRVFGTGADFSVLVVVFVGSELQQKTDVNWKFNKLERKLGSRGSSISKPIFGSTEVLIHYLERY